MTPRLSDVRRSRNFLTSSVGQDQKIIARATVAAVKLANEGKAPSKYWILEQADVVRLGKTEWKE
jgi:hypothetical protein